MKRKNLWIVLVGLLFYQSCCLRKTIAHSEQHLSSRVDSMRSMTHIIDHADSIEKLDTIIHINYRWEDAAKSWIPQDKSVIITHSAMNHLSRGRELTRDSLKVSSAHLISTDQMIEELAQSTFPRFSVTSILWKLGKILLCVIFVTFPYAFYRFYRRK